MKFHYVVFLIVLDVTTLTTRSTRSTTTFPYVVVVDTTLLRVPLCASVAVRRCKQ